jgi:ATP/ADP translocase/HEAT repeat protein
MTAFTRSQAGRPRPAFTKAALAAGLSLMGESAALARIDLNGVLESAFRIRVGEARRVGLMFLYLMGVVSTFIVSRTVRDTLFLSRYELSKLPLMYVAVAVSVAVASYGYSRIADRHRRDLLITVSLSIFAAVIALFWAALHLRLAGDWLYPALYVVVEIVGAISIIQFWTFANDIYSAREAKRLFGVIGAGGVISNIICGFAIGSVAPIIGSENLLLVCTGLLASCVVSVRAIAAIARSDLDEAVKKPRRSRIGLAADSGTVLGSRHLKIIAGIVTVTFLTVTIVDYQFKIIAKETYREAELAAYFGYFYGFTGIISSLFQFFLTGRILERLGVVFSLAILPLGLLSGAGAMLAVPMVSPLVAVTVAKGAENIFRYTVNDATTQLLYVPVPSHYRGRAKAFIDGILKPVSIGVAGLAIMGAARFLPKDRFALDLGYIDVALLAAWIILVIGVRREYVRSLINTLQTRGLDLSGPWSLRTDDATVSSLKTTLASPDEAHVLNALELLPSIEADFSVELDRLTAHASARVRIAALKLIGASKRPEAIAVIQRLLEDPDEGVRAAAIGAYCAIGRENAIRPITPFLADPSIPVRGAAVAALIKHGGLDGILTAAESLKSFLVNADPEVRLEAAHVLREIEVRNFFGPVLELLRDPDARVRAAAVEAAGAMQSQELVTPLIEMLAQTGTARAAIRALVAYGSSIERQLFRVLDDPSASILVRRKLPRVIGQIGGQEALTCVLGSLEAEDIELRIALARAASKIRERSPRVRIDDRLLDNAIRREIKDAYQALATIEDLALDPSELLPEALHRRHRVKLGLAFRLFEVRYPARTIQLVYSNLDADSKAVRANALEVADNLLSKEESRLILPLLEDLTMVEKVRRGAELFPIQRLSFEGWLTVLLTDPHPWVVACTLHLIGTRGLGGLKERAKEHLGSEDAVVRETARFCLTQDGAGVLTQHGPRRDPGPTPP